MQFTKRIVSCPLFVICWARASLTRDAKHTVCSASHAKKTQPQVPLEGSTEYKPLVQKPQKTMTNSTLIAKSKTVLWNEAVIDEGDQKTLDQP